MCCRNQAGIVSRLKTTSSLSQARSEEREAWYKLVVKIIIWKNTSLNQAVIDKTAQITQQEWDTYYQTSINTNTTYSKGKVLNDLEAARKAIKLNSGFKRS